MSNRTQKILIFFASLGSGHLSAANALRDTFYRVNPETVVQIVDAFPRIMKEGFIQDSMTTFSSLVFPGIYNHIWKNGWFKSVYNAFYSIGDIYDHVLSSVREANPDVVICTQSIPCSILANNKPASKPRLIAVSTDYGFHNYWPRKGVDDFCVASNSDVEKLACEGIPPDRIHATGIPVRNIERIKVAKGGHSSRKVLVVAGGGKTAPYRIVQPVVNSILCLALNNDYPDFQWSFVFGNNLKAKENAESMSRGHPNIRVMGFVADLQNLLLEADLVIAKPGGLIIGEALASGAAIGLLSRGAGQERANSDYVLNGGAAVNLGGKQTAPRVIEALLCDDEALKRMNRKSVELGNPDAAEDIVKITLKMES